MKLKEIFKKCKLDYYILILSKAIFIVYNTPIEVLANEGKIILHQVHLNEGLYMLKLSNEFDHVSCKFIK